MINGFTSVGIGHYQNNNKPQLKNTLKANKMKDSVIYECVAQKAKIIVTEDGLSYNAWSSNFGRYSKQRLLKSFDNPTEAINFARSIYVGQTEINHKKK